MVQGDVQDGPLPNPHFLNHLGAIDRVFFDDFPFDGAEGTGLFQNARVDQALAQVVVDEPFPEIVEVIQNGLRLQDPLVGQNALRKAHTQDAHVQAVGVRM